MSEDLAGKPHENCAFGGVLERKNLYAVECSKCPTVIHNPVLSSQTVLGDYDVKDPPCVVVVQVYKLNRKGQRTKELGLPQSYATVKKSDLKATFLRLGMTW